MAFSGGADSTALLHALIHAGHPQPVRAIHVCHNLLPDAHRWVAHCRAVCADWGVAFDCLEVQVERAGAGIEAGARQARYAALAAALRPGEVLVLAQHADDQAETFLIQALRGAGVAGLAAMGQWCDFAGGRLWRPLLSLPHSALLSYAGEHELSWVEDPSNHDVTLDRGYVRAMIWPQLQQRWPAASRTLSRSAHWCAEASALVQEVAAEDGARLMDARQRLEMAGLRRLSAFRQGGVIRHWLRQAGRDAPDHRHVAEIRRLLAARAHAGPKVAWRQTQVRAFDGCLYALGPLPPRPGAWQAYWPMRAPLALPPGCGVLAAQYAGAPAGAVQVGFRQGGERFVDPRRGGTRTLKAFLQEARIPPWRRPRLPLVFYRGQLVAIAHYWLDPRLVQWLGLSALRFIWQEPE
ncbi:MAG TPA: tRNA lysidine(34) synthetase TilS [Salinisphaeraceae bacterium]|nr:tRNA lysidine(34) synthetase TilS [Salinisphaeraceae bacterium]